MAYVIILSVLVPWMVKKKSTHQYFSNPCTSQALAYFFNQILIHSRKHVFFFLSLFNHHHYKNATHCVSRKSSTYDSKELAVEEIGDVMESH